MVFNLFLADYTLVCMVDFDTETSKLTIGPSNYAVAGQKGVTLESLRGMTIILERPSAKYQAIVRDGHQSGDRYVFELGEITLL